MDYTPQKLAHFQQLLDQATVLAQDSQTADDLPLRVTQWVTAAAILLQATWGAESSYYQQFQQAYRAAGDPADAVAAAQSTLRHGRRIFRAASRAYADEAVAAGVVA